MGSRRRQTTTPAGDGAANKVTRQTQNGHVGLLHWSNVPADGACARALRRQHSPSNLIVLEEVWQADPHKDVATSGFPSDHSASVHFFTGVQIVRQQQDS